MAVIALLVTLAFLASGCGKAAPEPEIELAPVPELAGTTLQEAREMLRDVGLKAGPTRETYSNTVTMGKIISSSPPAGDELETGSIVELTVSKGPEMLTLPAVVGSAEADAVAALQAMGFQVEVLRDYDESVGAGMVCAMEPLPAASAERGSQVILTVSLGSAYVSCVTCGGDGEVVTSITCPDCGGSGVCYT